MKNNKCNYGIKQGSYGNISKWELNTRRQKGHKIQFMWVVEHRRIRGKDGGPGLGQAGHQGRVGRAGSQGGAGISGYMVGSAELETMVRPVELSQGAQSQSLWQ